MFSDIIDIIVFSFIWTEQTFNIKHNEILVFFSYISILEELCIVIHFLKTFVILCICLLTILTLFVISTIRQMIIKTYLRIEISLTIFASYFRFFNFFMNTKATWAFDLSFKTFRTYFPFIIPFLVIHTIQILFIFWKYDAIISLILCDNVIMIFNILIE